MQSENKLCVVLLFGGMSSEHEVSRVSVGNFVNNIDRTKYEVLAVGITKEGRWRFQPKRKQNCRKIFVLRSLLKPVLRLKTVFSVVSQRFWRVVSTLFGGLYLRTALTQSKTR